MNVLALDLALHLRLQDPDFRQVLTEALDRAKAGIHEPDGVAWLEHLMAFCREHGHVDLISGVTVNPVP